MQLRSAFHLPVSVEEAWAVVEDVPSLARCLPNVTRLTVAGDRCEGELAVSVGLLTLTFTGSATIGARDDALHAVTIDATGAQSGRVRASAVIYVQLLPHHDETVVTVVTDLEADGALARLGHAPLAMASDRYWRTFGERLTEQLRPGSRPARRAALAPLSGAVGSTLRFMRTAIG